MSKSDLILAALLQEAKRQQLTPKQFADQADIPYAACHKLLNGQARRPTLETVLALAKVLNCSLELREGRATGMARVKP